MPFPHLYPIAANRVSDGRVSDGRRAAPRSPALIAHGARAMTEAAARAARGPLAEGRTALAVAGAYATLRDGLNGLAMGGTVVAAPAGCEAFRVGQSVGDGGRVPVDVAVAAIDMDGDGQVAVALAPGGALPRLGCDARVTLIVAPPAAAGRLDPQASVAGFMEDLARALGVGVRELSVRTLGDGRDDYGAGPGSSALIASTGPNRVAPANGVVGTAILAATPGLGVDALMGRADAASALVAACAARAVGAACFIRFEDGAAHPTARDRWMSVEEVIPSSAVSVVSTALITGPLGEAPGRADGFDRTQSVVVCGPEGERQQITTWSPLPRR